MTENGDEFDTGEIDCEKSESPNFFKSHSKLLSILGTNGGQTEAEKSDMATQADSDDIVGVEEPADHGANMNTKLSNEDASNSNDGGDKPQVVSISTDKIRDNIKSAPNILTRNDWRVLEITDGDTCEIANYAAIDHNYEVRLDKPSKNNEKDSVCVPEEQVNGWKIESVVSQADSCSPKKSKLSQEDSADTASTVSHITADIGHQRLRVERKRLSVERRRLCVEQEKLRLLRRLVKLEEKRLGKRGRKQTCQKTRGKRKRTGHRSDHKNEKRTKHRKDSEAGKDSTEQGRDWTEHNEDGMELQDSNDRTECRDEKNRGMMVPSNGSGTDLDGQGDGDSDGQEVDQGSGCEDVSAGMDHVQQREVSEEEEDVGEGRQEGEEDDQEQESVSEGMDHVEQKDQSDEDSGEGSVPGSRAGSISSSVRGSIEGRSEESEGQGGSEEEDDQEESGEEKHMVVDKENEEMSSAEEEKEEGECDESGEDDGERLSIKYLQCD
ncbi:cyclin-dependent kinase 11B-like [Haliotis rubra]|uniref:cyclin-dependent kinase 11B-like n=1 Tax=Haliotis rubra TaxID=36100 RepID=UPI001EE5950F|nr:cyclin-dependent kinase 11B-like [Haliotis rubra]